MKKYVMLLTVLLIGFSAQARKLEPKTKNLEIENEANSDQNVQTVKKVKVNGMVCSFCSTSLEKKFKKQKEISEIKVDLEKKDVTLIFKPGESLSDNKIKKMVKASGYDVVSVSDEKAAKSEVESL